MVLSRLSHCFSLLWCDSVTPYPTFITTFISIQYILILYIVICNLTALYIVLSHYHNRNTVTGVTLRFSYIYLSEIISSRYCTVTLSQPKNCSDNINEGESGTHCNSCNACITPLHVLQALHTIAL